MKSKLLKGIVKDLMKFPVGEKKMPEAPAMPEHGKAGVSITIQAGKHPMEEGSPEEEAMESPEEEMGEGGMMGKKSPLMEKAIHAKMKGKL